MKSISALCLLFFIAFTSAAPAATFYLSSVAKTPAHPFYRQGFGVGYAVNNVEGAELTLTVGRSYDFTVLSACNHPAYITTNPVGQGVDEISDNITVPTAQSYQSVCDGRTFTWTPSEAQVSALLPIGTSYYYQCRSHGKMGYKINVVSDTICNKYATALGVTTSDLVTLVVTNVFQRVAGPGALTREYFDGTIPTGSTNYTDPNNSGLAANLAMHLIEFFGIALGCSIDNTIPPYDGVKDMNVVHANMHIGALEFAFFNDQVIQVMRGAMVSEPDLKIVAGVLNSLKLDICTESDCRRSICDKYSDGLNITNVALVSTVVGGVFGIAVAPGSPLLQFFDGTTPAGSTDFTTNTGAKDTLAASLVAFFGNALGCTDAGFPAYTGPNMKDTHLAIPIGPFEFSVFNSAVISIMAGAGVIQADLNAVAVVLESLRADICNTACNVTQTTGTPTTGGTTAASSGAVVTTGAPPISTAFVFTVGAKSPAHPQNGKGFTLGFIADGVEGGEIFLKAGVSYDFINNAPCIHPLYLTNEPVGAPATNISAATIVGVAYPGGNFRGACGGGRFTFTPSNAQIGATIYYSCTNHMNMGWKVTVCADLSCGKQPGITTSPTPSFVTGIPVPTTGAPQVTTVAPAPVATSTTSNATGLIVCFGLLLVCLLL